MPIFQIGQMSFLFSFFICSDLYIVLGLKQKWHTESKNFVIAILKVYLWLSEYFAWNYDSTDNTPVKQDPLNISILSASAQSVICCCCCCYKFFVCGETVVKMQWGIWELLNTHIVSMVKREQNWFSSWLGCLYENVFSCGWKVVIVWACQMDTSKLFPTVGQLQQLGSMWSLVRCTRSNHSNMFYYFLPVLQFLCFHRWGQRQYVSGCPHLCIHMYVCACVHACPGRGIPNWLAIDL